MSLENELLMQANDNEIVLYQPNDAIRLEVRVEKDTVWLNRNQIAILFGRDVKTVGKHINNALQEELQGMATVAKFAIVHDEGGRRVTRTIDFYNLDMVLSVGYRVHSSQGVLFRQWANSVLKEYLLRGYSISQRFERLEQRVSRTKEKIDFFVLRRSHDRFLLIDDDVYHIGASIKDLGKKWFAIMKMQEIKAEDIISHL